MLIFSFGYLSFMAAATAIYIALPFRLKQIWLLLAGLLFTMFFIPKAVPYLLILIPFNFFCGRTLIRYNKIRRVLAAGIAGNFVLFISYKICMDLGVFDFLHWIPASTPTANHPFVFYIGAAFLMLQCISYLIEIHRGRIPTLIGLMGLSQYILFFPKLVAGPLEKPQDFIAQCNESHTHTFNRQRLAEGCRLVLWGIFQKVVIADRLAVISSAAFSDPAHHYGWELVLGTLCFTLELYFDLCAYTDISLGFAHMMGFRLKHHFNLPFSADRPFHYWSNNMISLTSWVKEYTTDFLSAKFKSSSSKLYIIAILLLCSIILSIGNGPSFLLWGVIWILSVSSSKSFQTGLSPPLALPFASRWLVWISACAASAFLAFPSGDGLFIYFKHIFTHLSQIQGLNLALNLGLLPLDFWLGVGAIAIAIATGYGKFGMKGSYPFTVMRLQEHQKWKRWAFYYLFVSLLLLMGIFKPTPFLFGF